MERSHFIDNISFGRQGTITQNVIIETSAPEIWPITKLQAPKPNTAKRIEANPLMTACNVSGINFTLNDKLLVNNTFGTSSSESIRNTIDRTRTKPTTLTSSKYSPIKGATNQAPITIKTPIPRSSQKAL